MFILCDIKFLFCFLVLVLQGAALFNKGNTCYINAILQCFTHTVPLVQALRSCNHEMPCEYQLWIAT